ncbi:pilus assembly PilX family protein [Nitrosomonas oligotropha]|uniref:Type IV pilus assembly protein PilX n=1 Tax=Nitrosomonas oligotropha TaxID=42354 RepID=A0A1H8JGY6_9PROT|nr:PilX N-terminal domain-containing pilus assembly protein [Nitrosomonas oligotropha]SDW03677.1 type IV pilus assembly protein PilX [Nitrosomonas oligotropha]SEN80054.1 type IV pilus assembly protein PilX [Nitrosomonas oligotropha]
MNINSYLHQRQSGAVFVTGLIFLLVLSLLGITAAKMATIEERMSANIRDRMLATQAAEMALRYAEHHIRDNDPSTNSPKSIEGMSEFDTNCTDGFCYYGSGVDAPAVSSWTTYCTPACPISYVTGNIFRVDGVAYTAPNLPAGVPAPTYLIEGIQKTPPGNFLRYYYRITVRAQGAKQGTVVWLQEVFRP